MTYSQHSIMSQAEQDLDNSQKEGKDSGICGICLGQFKLLRQDGRISKHDPRSNPCLRCYTVPIRSTGCGPKPATTGTNTSLFALISVNYGKPTYSQASSASDHTLSRSSWTAKISRILRSARASCRSLLTDIISRIVADPGSKSAWNKFLYFVPAILSKPRHGGAKSNLSNIINKITAN